MKKKKGLIIGIVILLLLLGAYFLLRYLNLDEDNTEEEDTTETVFEIDAEDISNIQIVSGENTFDFSHGDDTWSYVQDANFPLSESSILDKVSSLTSISSSRTIENPEKLSDYGLEDPEVTATVTDTEGETTKLSLGTTNDAVSGCYMSLNDDTSKIYLVDTSLKTNLQFDLSDIAVKEDIPSITGSTITSVTIQKPEGTARLYQDSTSETGWTFADTDGSTVPADSSLVSTYTSNFSALAWTDYVTYDLSNLETYGLDNPTVITVDYQVEEEAEDSSSEDTETSDDSTEESTENTSEDSEDTEEDSTVTVDKQMVMLLGDQTEDGNYYYGKLQDDTCIYTIGLSSIQSITDIQKEDFLSTKVADYSFADLDTVTFTRNGETYVASKETVEVESEDEDGETTEETRYLINDKEIDTTDFNSFYNLITAMTWQSQDDSAQPSGEPDISINFYKDGGINVTVDYYSYDTNFYLVIDSKGNHSLVNKMDVRELLEAFDSAMEALEE